MSNPTYDEMTPAQQAEIDRQENEREARKANYCQNDPMLPDDWNPADYVFVSPEDQAKFPSDEDMDRMVAEYEEEMMARAEMESAGLLKYTNGEWS